MAPNNPPKQTTQAHTLKPATTATTATPRRHEEDEPDHVKPNPDVEPQHDPDQVKPNPDLIDRETAKLPDHRLDLPMTTFRKRPKTVKARPASEGERMNGRALDPQTDYILYDEDDDEYHAAPKEVFRRLYEEVPELAPAVSTSQWKLKVHALNDVPLEWRDSNGQVDRVKLEAHLDSLAAAGTKIPTIPGITISRRK